MKTFLPCLVVFACAAAFAQNDAGKQIASAGTPGGATACIGCHGAQGEGNPAGGFPRLAGQSQAYLARQLRNYAEGSRSHPVMTPIAKALNAQQAEAVAAYYASLATPPAANSMQPDQRSRERGAQLATVGDNRIAVQACANCHGPDGTGEPPGYPYLAGQNVTYLTAALSAWKSGARKTDPSQQMNMIASRLSDADIASLAAYYAAQPAPPPKPANLPARATGEAATRAGSIPVQGIGTEQGAATSGGSQGQGGGGGASGSGPSGNPTGSAR